MGMNVSTGARLTGLNHIRQSVADILLTPIGSRVMRREYGSLLPDLIDRPITGALLLQVYATTFMALRRWEPRVRVESVIAKTTDTKEQLSLDIAITRLDTPVLERATIAVTVGRSQ